MRAIWKGHIQFSLTTIPIGIYNAIDTAQKTPFGLLSKETNNPVKYEKRDKVTGDVLVEEDMVKGFLYGPGRFVVVEDEDVEKVKTKSSNEGFVDAGEVDHAFFDAPCFAGADGTVAAKPHGRVLDIKLEDKYNDALRDMADRKTEGQGAVAYMEEGPGAVDIMTALKAGIEQAKAGKKPMKKAAPKKEEWKRKASRYGQGGSISS